MLSGVGIRICDNICTFWHVFRSSLSFNFTPMGSTTIEITRDQWPVLRDLYAGDRTNLTGFDLLEYFINYQPLSDGEAIKIYTTDTNWSAHGSYILMVGRIINRIFIHN